MRDGSLRTKYDGFRMAAKIENRKVTLYSRYGRIISQSYANKAELNQSSIA
jgi:ATP-dependent DNA ligase